MTSADPQPLADLHRSHHHELVGYARRLLDGDRATAEDIVQEAFLATHRVLLDDPSRPVLARPWLYRLVRNAALDELRSARRRRTSPLVAARDTPDAEADPASVLVDREALRQALGLVAALPPRQQEALVLHAVHGLDHDAVGAELRVSRGASRALVHRARRSFAPQMSSGTISIAPAGHSRAQMPQPLQ